MLHVGEESPYVMLVLEGSVIVERWETEIGIGGQVRHLLREQPRYEQP